MALLSVISSLWFLSQSSMLSTGDLLITIIITLIYEVFPQLSSILGLFGVTLLLPDAIFTSRSSSSSSFLVWSRRFLALASLIVSLLCNSSIILEPSWGNSIKERTLSERYSLYYGKISIQDAIEASENTSKNQNVVIYPLKTDKEWFRERTSLSSRVVMIRAINLSGETKFPVGCQTHVDCLKMDPQNVSFVGRPFPISSPVELQAAKVHLARIRSWGFNAIRLLVSWEAVEHEGPGTYDHQYLEYVRSIVQLCATFGLGVIIDFHQDLWSRFSGGDGAPAWTLEAAGFDVNSLFESEAALLSEAHPNITMLWPTNVERLAVATMFTLFFAGNTFAPSCLVKTGKKEKVPIQTFLQEHYLATVKELARYLQNESNVIGWDTLNEPYPGYVGMKNLRKNLFPAPLGWHISAFQGMLVASGVSPVKIPKFCSFYVFCGIDELNQNNRMAWKNASSDIWRNEGVWFVDSVTGDPKLLRPDYFHYNRNGEVVDFTRDFMLPFYKSFSDSVKEVIPDANIFFEPAIDLSDLSHAPVHLDIASYANAAFAPHFYDVSALMLKKIYKDWIFLKASGFPLVFGVLASRHAIAVDLGLVKNRSIFNKKPALPVFIGEIGTSMGIRDSFQTGEFIWEALALDRSMQALEANLLSFALWNYAPNNSNMKGDGWNGEDLSLFSTDQYFVTGRGESNINSGGRAIEAAIRPYPMKTCGIPKKISFDAKSNTRSFLFLFETAEDDCEFCGSFPTVMFIPTFQYPNGIECSVSDGHYQYIRADQILLYYATCATSNHTVLIVSQNVV